MSDVTRILSAIEEGDAAAAEKLLPLVYDELRRWQHRSWSTRMPAILSSRPHLFMTLTCA